MTSGPTAGSNPFATKFIRPGAIPYQFPPGISVESLTTQLKAQHWRGSIIGPHGSGKSSLIAALIPTLEAQARVIVRQQLHGGQRALDWQSLNWRNWNERTLVIVDGYEQLSFWQRLLLRARCLQRGAGLLVTAHQPVSLPAIFTTQPTFELALRIVQQLLPDSDDQITPADVAEAYAAQRGDLREMLLSLYDVFRQRS
ncbi:hypothetical protein ETAA8_64100 [Anatilimnocola aggregata]|uniref:AAA+ ATPase domain-containing protein n=1 Tax=Anatilimnocola aggregata TaxID=2528021 RepID=A0A517YM10_9BACT|nr:hypothetical protein [Anatilimnocola aggregata]QDU31257.1 hypothetical protein ETAA8_64100 [Anatilimnocola aggregata]